MSSKSAQPQPDLQSAAAPGSEACGANPAPVVKGSHVFLIDGSGYIFRAFHALPPLTRPSDGLPVGAVHGFCGMLWKLLRETKVSDAPTHMAVIFDKGHITFRNAIYPDYKAHRPALPDELVPQFPLIRDATRAFNVCCIEQEGYEADDLIATYACQALAAGGDVTIVSSDKDLMQLICPGIAMLDTMKNKRIGMDEVRERFGVGPDKVIDVQALAGDSTDNVPGVPGIGVKTAAELIGQYGDLDTLLERAGEIKQPKRREKLIEFAEQARISRELVRLKLDVPIEVPLAAMAVGDPAPETLIAFMRAMEFSTLTKRVAEGMNVAIPPAPERPAGQRVDRAGAARAPRQPAGGGVGRGDAPALNGAAEAGSPAALAHLRAAEIKKIPCDRTKYETVPTLAQLEQWISRARETGVVAFDIETDSLDAMRANVIGVSLAIAPNAACYVPLGHTNGGGLDLIAREAIVQVPMAEALAALKPLLEDESILKVGQNLKYDCLVLAQRGIAVAPIDDTLLISYALDAGRGGHGLDVLAERHLNHTCITYKHVIAKAEVGDKSETKSFARVPVREATEYSAEDADLALRLWQILKPRLPGERMATVYETLERPLLPVLVDMERAGIKVDRNILSRLSGDFAQSAARLEAAIQELSGARFNLASPRQLGEFLFDHLKLPGGRRTKNGQWETRAGLLDDLAANEELPEGARKLVNLMLEWRQLTKLKSTYTDALPTYIHPDTGRIHTCFSLGATSTGRLSSADPNLQNIPVRTREGRQIRTAFIADKGFKLISADYSQIELRVLAHMADIPQLRKAFADGLDIHAMTASEMFGVPVKGMPAEVRRRAKAINFGIIYGISAFGLANQLGISREEAGIYIKTYFQRFPGIRDYMEATKARARQDGYVTTIFGRKAHYPEINTKNPSMRGFLERAAINAPIQGSAADIIRRAMIRMPAALAGAGLDSARMLLQVHDELVFEAREAEVEGTIAVARAVMEKAAEPAVALAVPLHVDAKAAANWEEAH